MFVWPIGPARGRWPRTTSPGMPRRPRAAAPLPRGLGRAGRSPPLGGLVTGRPRPRMVGWRDRASCPHLGMHGRVRRGDRPWRAARRPFRRAADPDGAQRGGQRAHVWADEYSVDILINSELVRTSPPHLPPTSWTSCGCAEHFRPGAQPQSRRPEPRACWAAVWVVDRVRARVGRLHRADCSGRRSGPVPGTAGRVVPCHGHRMSRLRSRTGVVTV